MGMEEFRGRIGREDGVGFVLGGFPDLGQRVSKGSCRRRPRRFVVRSVKDSVESKPVRGNRRTGPIEVDAQKVVEPEVDVSHVGEQLAESEDVAEENGAESEGPSSSDLDKGLATLQMFGWKVKVPGRLLLAAVPLLWGSFGPSVRFLYSVEHAPRPSLFNAERLSLSALVYSIVLIVELNKRREAKKSAEAESPSDVPTKQKDEWTWLVGGLELGLYVFLANVAQVLGLQSVGAGRAAFLNQLQTVIVPFLGFVIGIERNLSVRTIVSSVIAVLGVSLLASDSNPEIVSSLKGDTLEVTSALFFSLYILRISRYSQRVPVPLLVGGKVIVQAFLAWLWVAQSISTSQTQVHIYPDGGLADVAKWAAVVAWTGLMSSALSGWLQTAAQKVVSPSEAAVVFASQPLVAAALSWLLLGERLDLQGAMGGVLIIGATIYGSLKPSPAKADEKTS